MRLKKPRQASKDEVSITRDGDNAVIQFRDPMISTTHLKIGPNINSMSDQAILDRFNDVMDCQDLMLVEHDNVVTEIPPGRPQIDYHELCEQWVPRGGLLRCLIEDDGADGEITVSIDDQTLTPQEFGKLLRTYAGWGMRIAFVPEELVHEEPRREVREPHETDS